MKTAILGLTLDKSIQKKEWCDLVRSLATQRTRDMWMLGDALNFGLAEYGESFVTVQANIGLEIATLYNIASVCARVPITRRKAELSFSHHTAVASLSGEKQRKVLAQAIEQSLSVADLRQLLRAESSEPENIEAPTERSPLLTWLASGIRLLAIEARGNWPEPRRQAFAASWSQLSASAAKIIGPPPTPLKKTSKP